MIKIKTRKVWIKKYTFVDLDINQVRSIECCENDVEQKVEMLVLPEPIGDRVTLKGREMIFFRPKDGEHEGFRNIKSLIVEKIREI